MLHLRDIMSKHVLTVSPDLPVREAIELLVRHHVSGAPVVAGGHVLVVITAYDLLSLEVSDGGSPEAPAAVEIAAEGGSAAIPDEWDIEIPVRPEFFRDIEVFGGAEVPAWVEGTDAPLMPDQEGVTVSDVMSREVYSLPPDASIAAAAECLRRAGVHRVLVMESGRLLGVVSSMDITTAVAEERFVESVEEPVAAV
jgi:CBS domain-containing protein